MDAHAGNSILLVDDDARFRAAMAELLESRGFTVATASNGEDALARLRSGRIPTVIVLDLVMPSMNGLRFRTEQLSDRRLAAIPTVAYSTDSHLRRTAESLGLTFISKLDVDAMVERVATLSVQHDRRPAGEALMDEKDAREAGATTVWSAAQWRQFALRWVTAKRRAVGQRSPGGRASEPSSHRTTDKP